MTTAEAFDLFRPWLDLALRDCPPAATPEQVGVVAMHMMDEAHRRMEVELEVHVRACKVGPHSGREGRCCQIGPYWEAELDRQWLAAQSA